MKNYNCHEIQNCQFKYASIVKKIEIQILEKARSKMITQLAQGWCQDLGTLGRLYCWVPPRTSGGRGCSGEEFHRTHSVQSTWSPFHFQPPLARQPPLPFMYLALLPGLLPGSPAWLACLVVGGSSSLPTLLACLVAGGSGSPLTSLFAQLTRSMGSGTQPLTCLLTCPSC